MFNTFIVEPVFNLLVLIYAILPGHNFGLAIILFTIVVRFIMHPLVKKQLHHSKAMRDLQPEINAIKKACGADKQKAAKLTMELYKEREVKPISSLGPVAVQVLVLIGLYTGLQHIAKDPQSILDNSYDWLTNFGYMKELAADITKFDFTLFGWADLSRAANGPAGFYLPSFILVIGSVIAQYFMGKQTLPEDDNARSLKRILKESRSGGDKVGISEVQALFGKLLKFAIPTLIFFLTYSAPSAIALYWLIGGVAGYFQQKRILSQDQTELLAKA